MISLRYFFSLGFLAAAFLVFGAPAFSSASTLPANGWLVFDSDISGQREVYLRAPNGTITPLTTTGGEAAVWSPDGRWISYLKRRCEVFPYATTKRVCYATTYVMRWLGEADADHHMLCAETEKYETAPTFWTPDNRGVLCTDGTDEGTLRLKIVDPDTTTVSSWVDANLLKSRLTLQDFNWFSRAAHKEGRWILAHTAIAAYGSGFTFTNDSIRTDITHVLYDLNNFDDIWLLAVGEGPSALSPINDDVLLAQGDSITKMTISERQHPFSSQQTVFSLPADAPPDSLLSDLNFATDGQSFTIAQITAGGASGALLFHRFGDNAGDNAVLLADGKLNRGSHMFVGELWGTGGSRLALKPTQLVYDSQAQAALSIQNVSATNLGTGVLSQLEVASITYEGTPTNWLTVQACALSTCTGTTNNPQRVSNEVNLSGLSAGVYRAHVTLRCQNNTCGTATYTYTLVFPHLDSILLSPTPDVVESGTRVEVSALPSDPHGNNYATNITWLVSGGGVMTPTASLASGPALSSVFLSDGSPGDFTIEAHSGSLFATAVVTVLPVPEIQITSDALRSQEPEIPIINCSAAGASTSGAALALAWLARVILRRKNKGC